MSKAQTDNSYFSDKVLLRLKHLPRNDIVSVLDCFHATGSIWNEVRKWSDKKIRVDGIDVKHNRRRGTLRGLSEKFLSSLDLTRYDIIDLDAYGWPVEQLELLFKSGWKGHVFVTMCHPNIGITIPDIVLRASGYSKNMSRKAPALFGTKHLEKLLNYLAHNGIEEVWHRSSVNQHYMFFRI